MMLDEMMQDLLLWYPNETGGVLMGYWSSNEAIITGIIYGGPSAIRAKMSFIPDHTYQKISIAEWYKKSERTETYLGDWHTHPNANAYLSIIDKQTFRKIANYKQARLTNPIMIVLGTRPNEIKAWVYKKSNIFFNSFVIARLKIF